MPGLFGGVLSGSFWRRRSLNSSARLSGLAASCAARKGSWASSKATKSILLDHFHEAGFSLRYYNVENVREYMRLLREKEA